MIAGWGIPAGPVAARMLQAQERADRQQQARLAAEAEERRDRAQMSQRQFIAEYGCSPNQFAAERAASQARRQEKIDRELRQERERRHNDAMSGYLASGREPRSLQQVLRIAELAG